MAEHSFFFNSIPEDPRVYQASDFAQYFSVLTQNGVYKNNGNLEVTADGTSMHTTLSTGSAFINGYRYENDEPLLLEHSLADPTFDRIDLVVLRLDLNQGSRYIKAFVKQGTPSAIPTAPDLSQNEYIYEIPLAEILIIAGQSVINQSQITDKRGAIIEPMLNRNFTELPRTQFDGNTSGEEYPIGNTILNVGDVDPDNSAGFPTLGIAITHKLLNTRLIQYFHSNGSDGVSKVWTRTWYTGVGWSEWNQIDGQGENWINATLINGWSNYDLNDPTFPRVQYRKITRNLVHVRGMIKGGSIGSVAFVLPTDYRPPSNVYVSGVCNGWDFSASTVGPNGNFTVRSGDNAWIAFDIIYATNS